MLPQKHYFWMTTKPTVMARRTAKNVYINKKTTLHGNHAILYISWPSLHHYNMKLPIFMSLLYGVCEHNTKIVTFFF